MYSGVSFYITNSYIFFLKDKNINKYGSISIGKISVDILTKILVDKNCSKFMDMLGKISKNDKISKNIHVKVIL